ncbi:SDR family NAD(P)-dependent oxidoreductase [Longitalea luteola]|uniref:SDR family NAD(P)-dependent oxidoreductase n=1 Tax=Longitalea luteola TaxID=2812563 RepID=UPI001A968DFE|nr:SDR family NAD(P)-dependent oxidoreductase [Longitalea luteola]
MKTVLITGATSGFGKAMAERFAANNHNVIITGRRADRLNELSQQLTSSYQIKVHPLVFDVRDRDAVFAAIEQLPADLKNIDVLINNAGLALGRDYFEDAETEDWEIMIDTNVKGVMYVTKAVIPAMIARKQGHIINMGSIAGKEVYEKGNGYCASKYALDALSQSMRVDLLRHKIKVTAIHPGAAETEFSMVRFKGNAAAAEKIYDGYQPLSAADVADVVYYTSTLPPHVCINDLVLTCLAQANSFYLHK